MQLSTWTARGGRLQHLPPGARQVGRRAPARVLQAAWARVDVPRIEALVGPTDVFHGTNFVSPPTRTAREVVTVHDLTFDRHAETVSAASLAYRRLVPRALDRGAHVVVPTDTVRQDVVRRYGLEPERVTTTPLGVDRAWFDSVAATPDWLRDRRLPVDYVVFVGSLDPRKNLPALVDAHARARAADPTTPDLVLAGPAGREATLEDRPGVARTGWLEEGDLRAVVAAARALALPSLDEGFGLPVAEALASGRPVLAADLPVLHEVAGQHAVFADPHDVDALAQGLLDVLAVSDGPDDRHGRRTWAARFDWARCADRTVDAYLAVLP